MTRYYTLQKLKRLLLTLGILLVSLHCFWNKGSKNNLKTKTRKNTQAYNTTFCCITCIDFMDMKDV